MFFQVNLCQIIHQSVAVSSIKFKEEMSRHNYVTPTSYLELLGIFSKLVGMKKMELSTSRNRLKTGLEKVLSSYHISALLSFFRFLQMSNSACKKCAF